MDQEKLRLLHRKGFEQLYLQHKSEWNVLFEKTADLCRSVLPLGKTLDGDIHRILKVIVSLETHFYEHLTAEKLFDKSIPWSEYFADYIILKNGNSHAEHGRWEHKRP
jgi:hypothetical protein